MRLVTPSLFALTVLALAAAPAMAREAESGGGRGNNRALHDVRVKLSKAKPTVGGTRIKVSLQNRGRSAEAGVTVSLFSDTDPGTPVWTTTTDLRRKGHRDWKLVLDLPESTGALTVTASCGSTSSGGTGESDDHPEDNDDSTPVPVPPVGSGGMTAAEAGAVLYTSLCAGCHGATGRGGTVDENISDASAHEVMEAIREGEDGMPTYPGLTSEDTRNIAAYLLNPVAPPTPPTPPTPTPTPTPTTPTYAGQIAAIMSASCTSCHSGTGASAKIRLDTYANVSANAATSLSSIQAGRMPIAGPLSAGTIATFKAWIDGGKPK